ncbi:glycosyltransferase family 39 protein [Gemmatimonas aurantiaca]|nr:glycosyltransferase family 39 protein [Gemmatimonas aurantiaca]
MKNNDQISNSIFHWPGGAHLYWLAGTWLVLALPTLIYPVGRDQGVFAYIGSRLFEGARLYTDLWDVKSPLIYWSFGLAQKLLGESAFSIRLFDALIVALTVTLVWSLAVTISKSRDNSERLGGATVAGLVYLLWYYLPNDYRVLANCESFIQPFVILSLIFLITSLREDNDARQFRLLLITGLMLGIMPLYKTTTVVFIIPALLALSLKDAKTNLRVLLSRTTAMLGGFVIPLILCGLYLWQTEALAQWSVLNLEYLPSYTALSHQGGALSSFKVSLYFGKDMIRLYPALIAGMLLFLWRMRSSRNKPLEVVALFAMTYAGVVIVQGKYLNYHFLPFLAPFAIVITTSALATLEDFRTRVWQRVIAVSIVALTLMHGWNLLGRFESFGRIVIDHENFQAEYYEGLSQGNYPCAEAHAVGAYLKANASTDAKLFIWSFEPEIYYLSDLNPASRFLFNTPFLAGEVADSWRAELIATLSANPPEYFVVGVNDGLPLIVGSGYSSAERLQDVPGLLELLANYYEEDTQIGRFIIFRYRTLAYNSNAKGELVAELSTDNPRETYR